MVTGDGFNEALVRVATGYQSDAEVFELEPPAKEKIVSRAAAWNQLVWDDFRKCTLHNVMGGTDAVVSFRFSNGGSLSVFPMSGGAEAVLAESWREEPIAADESKADRKGLRGYIDSLATRLAAGALQADEELRIEAIWEIKGRGVTVEGEYSPTSLLAAVGAYRRYVGGLPVLGRASVHVKFGGGFRPTGWGVEWRARSARVIAKSPVISPEEGATRVSEELFRLRPGRPSSLEVMEPESFQLGYVSSGRRSLQRTLQPAWVAVLRPRGGFRAGKVVAVPAAPVPYGPVVSPAAPLRRLNS